MPENLRGEHYENEVRECPPEFLGDDAKEIVVRNDRGQEIMALKIRPSRSYLVVEHFNKQFELGDFRRSTTLESPLEKTHILNLLTKGDQMYLSKV